MNDYRKLAADVLNALEKTEAAPAENHKRPCSIILVHSHVLFCEQEIDALIEKAFEALFHGASVFLSETIKDAPKRVMEILHELKLKLLRVVASALFRLTHICGMPSYNIALLTIRDVLLQATGQYRQPPGTTRPSWLGGDAGRRQLYLDRGTPDFGLNISNSFITSIYIMEDFTDVFFAS